jgi:hypothetical protein
VSGDLEKVARWLWVQYVHGCHVGMCF